MPYTYRLNSCIRLISQRRVLLFVVQYWTFFRAVKGEAKRNGKTFYWKVHPLCPLSLTFTLILMKYSLAIIDWKKLLKHERGPRCSLCVVVAISACVLVTGHVIGHMSPIIGIERPLLYKNMTLYWTAA